MLQVTGSYVRGSEAVLTREALEFVAQLHRQFGRTREKLLVARDERSKRLASGEVPALLDSTRSIREGDWKVAPCPKDLQDRRVEITGPAEAKMMINALNSGAKVFMADLEDAMAPTWVNVVEGQLALKAAVRRELHFKSPDGKEYALKPKIATLLVRPRGWHLEEKHIEMNGVPTSGSLVDFGLFFFHNAAEALRRGTGPYFYLPKMESHLEARLWNDVFVWSQNALGIPQGSIRATVLIETLLAAFEMDEILYELRDHASGLNAGRWDYIFSVIKKVGLGSDRILPDRSDVTMAVPFMKAYAELLVKTCHRRGAHAMGGMSAFIPNRKDPEVTEKALAKVREDKEREAGQGFDGTWVAHPDLVPVAMEVFDRKLGKEPNQKKTRIDEAVPHPDVKALIDTRIPGAKVTEAGVRTNISVALRYMERWLSGQGAVALDNLMEDAATAEISRAQLWQWLKNGVKLSDGRPLNRLLFAELRDSEIAKLPAELTQLATFQASTELLNRLVTESQFAEFLTLPAYRQLD